MCLKKVLNIFIRNWSPDILSIFSDKFLAICISSITDFYQGIVGWNPYWSIILKNTLFLEPDFLWDKYF